MARNRSIGRSTQKAHATDRVAPRKPTSVKLRVKRSVLHSSPYERGGSGLSMWREPSALFCVSLICFMIVYGLRLWENGTFDPIFGPKSALVEKGPVRFAPHNRKAAKPYLAAEPADADEATSDGALAIDQPPESNP
jgi:hypothetical protein